MATLRWWAARPFPCQVLSPPWALRTWSSLKTHNGTFTRGNAASYKIHVSNAGGATTVGTATVVDPMPTSVTYTGFSGSGWSCSSATSNGITTVTCTNSTVVAAGSAYADLTLNVNVSVAAPNAVSNTVNVSGGGEINPANNSSTDLVTIPPQPDLTVTKSHSANLYWGETNVAYTIRVTNVNTNSTTSGTVTVVDTLPVGLSLVSMTGTGWACGGTTCTRSDALLGNAAYPPITVTVNVANNAPATVTNRATVSGGGEVNTTNDTVDDSGSVGSLGARRNDVYQPQHPVQAEPDRDVLADRNQCGTWRQPMGR